jgi:signal transduction histidine kinase
LLHALVEEVFEDTAAMGVVAQNKTPQDLSIIADRTQLYRVLFNLVRNSVEAMTERATLTEAPVAGEVSIEASVTDNAIAILVSDDGPGLPGHAKAELFEPFKGTQKPGGSGLGVAIAAEIARAHAGVISLHRSDENGAVFLITLPQNAAGR